MDSAHHNLIQSISGYVNQWLKFGFIATTVLSLGLGFALYQSMRHKMIVMVPPVMTHQASVSLVKPDESYVVQMGLFWLGLKLNISSDNVEQNHRILKSHIHPDAWGALQNILEQEAHYVQKNKITSVFYPTNQEIDLDRLRLRVTGKLQKRVGERLISDKTAHFVMQFYYHNGALQIIDMFQHVDKKDNPFSKGSE